MNYKFDVSQEFKKDFKTLLKKYKSLKKDFEILTQEIQENPNIGVDLGGGYRKIRLAISSKNKGKSGGARVITHEIIINFENQEETKSILFVYIYDKSDYENIDLEIIKQITTEFRENTKE